MNELLGSGGGWVYLDLKQQAGCYTVGHYGPDGRFEPESDHRHAAQAAARVHYLNGGLPPGVEHAPPLATDTLKRALEAAGAIQNDLRRLLASQVLATPHRAHNDPLLDHSVGEGEDVPEGFEIEVVRAALAHAVALARRYATLLNHGGAGFRHVPDARTLLERARERIRRRQSGSVA